MNHPIRRALLYAILLITLAAAIAAFAVAPTGLGNSIVGSLPNLAPPPQLTITFAGTGSGTVTVSDTTTPANDTSCTSTCLIMMVITDTGTLGATANAGSTFAGWSNQSLGITGCSPTTCNFSMDSTAQSVTVTFTKVATDTTTVVASSVSPSVVGQSVTFTATVTPNSGPTGAVTFKEGLTILGSGTLSGGHATFTSSSLLVGSHSITAVYAGDSNFNSSTSSAITQIVNKANTTTTLASSANPSVSGQSVTFTANVSAVAPGSGTPSGTVTFKDGSTTLGTGTLSGGHATFSTSSLSVGTHSTINAVYGGDTSFNTSTSANIVQTVNQVPSPTNTTGSQPAATGTPTSATGTPTSATGTPIPLATITPLLGAGAATVTPTPTSSLPTTGSSPLTWIAAGLVLVLIVVGARVMRQSSA